MERPFSRPLAVSFVRIPTTCNDRHKGSEMIAVKTGGLLSTTLEAQSRKMLCYFFVAIPLFLRPKVSASLSFFVSLNPDTDSGGHGSPLQIAGA